MTRGFPQGQKAQVFPSPGGSELSSRRIAEGFPSANKLKVSLCRVARGFPPLPGWLRVLPWPEAAELPVTGGPRFPSRRVARSFLFAGGSELLLARRPGFALCRAARSFPLTVARGFPFAGYRPGGRRISTPVAVAAQGVWASNFKILWPSTSHPQLTPGCPPRRDLLHRILHRMIHRRVPAGRWAGQPSAG